MYLDDTFKLYKKLENDLKGETVDFHILKTIGHGSVILEREEYYIVMDYSKSFISTLSVGRYGLAIFTGSEDAGKHYYFRTYKKLLEFLKGLD